MCSGVSRLTAGEDGLPAGSVADLSLPDTAPVVDGVATDEVVWLDPDAFEARNCDCWGLCGLGILSPGDDEDDWRFMGGGLVTVGPKSDERGVPARVEEGAVEGVLVLDATGGSCEATGA